METNLTKLYEVECFRNNVTPREFFRYCNNMLKKKGETLSSWIDEYEYWKNPAQNQEYTIYNHEDWEEPLKEGNKYKPYEWHLFLAKNYNFIMEFEFDDEKRGHGYFYVVEYER